jgi:hypothetical protein
MGRWNRRQRLCGKRDSAASDRDQLEYFFINVKGFVRNVSYELKVDYFYMTYELKVDYELGLMK